MIVDLTEFEVDWIQSVAAHAIRSNLAHDKARIDRGREPEKGARITKLTQLAEKMRRIEAAEITKRHNLRGDDSIR